MLRIYPMCWHTSLSAIYENEFVVRVWQVFTELNISSHNIPQFIAFSLEIKRIFWTILFASFRLQWICYVHLNAIASSW